MEDHDNQSTTVPKPKVLETILPPMARYFGADRVRALRVTCWIVLVMSGLVQAWYVRHRITADGISYLEIAKNYAAGNWHNALNDYWSPLYSWLIAILTLISRPTPYWQVAILYLLNFCAYIAALIGFELSLGALIRFQAKHMDESRLSEATIRLTGYSIFLVATLLLIDMGWNSPDMVATAIGFFVAYLLIRIAEGGTSPSGCVLLGVSLGLEYLARTAFAPFVPLHILIATVLLRAQRMPALRPVAYIAAAAATVTLPFVLGISISDQRLTLGEAGKLNYAWEVCGASRYIHWQGEPYDIGKPFHPTQKVLAHPETYTFANPVPGSYPPWYRPSYWYAGVKPHLKFKPQLAVFRGSCETVAYLLLRSPVTIPVFALIFFMGWRNWLSWRGVYPYWFLLLPAVAYLAVFMLVYVDSRYVAGSLVVIWMCLLASVSIHRPVVGRKANLSIQLFALLFGLTFIVTRLALPARLAADDLIHFRESEWNLNWMIANRFQQLGLRPNEGIAWIGQSMDAEWVDLLGDRIVAEVPVIWLRQGGIMRRVEPNEREVKAFWRASREQKARVFDQFRKAGARIAVVDYLPRGTDTSGWQHVLPPGTQHIPWSGGQHDWQKDLAFMWLRDSGNPAK